MSDSRNDAVTTSLLTWKTSKSSIDFARAGDELTPLLLEQPSPAENTDQQAYREVYLPELEAQQWFPKGEFDHSPEAVYERYIAFIRAKYPRSENEIMNREQVAEALKKAKLARKICDEDFLEVCVGDRRLIECC